jgi:hypothetical protein
METLRYRREEWRETCQINSAPPKSLRSPAIHTSLCNFLPRMAFPFLAN